MRLRMFFLFFTGIVFFVGVWAFFIEPNIIKTERVSLQIRELPRPFNNVKILHISDFHLRRWSRKEEKILEKILELNPDYIFITGDIIDWQTRDLSFCRQFLERLSESFQGRVFAVYGNHEHRNPRLKILDKLLQEERIEILNNRSTALKRDNDFIYLLGVDDPHLGYDNLERAISNTKENKPKILLAHSPEIFRSAKKKDIDLVLSGHTHGCQVNVPILCRLIIPLKHDKKYRSGLFYENGVYLYVSRGIGETFFPIRFNSFPELSLITLFGS